MKARNAITAATVVTTATLFSMVAGALTALGLDGDTQGLLEGFLLPGVALLGAGLLCALGCVATVHRGRRARLVTLQRYLVVAISFTLGGAVALTAQLVTDGQRAAIGVACILGVQLVAVLVLARRALG